MKLNLKKLEALALPVVMFASALMLPGPVSSPPAMAEEEGGNPGEAVFLAEKCNICHAVSSAGIEAKVKSDKMRGPDLTEVTTRHDVDWIKKYLIREEELDGVLHKKEYKGSEGDLDKIMAWLNQQKE